MDVSSQQENNDSPLILASQSIYRKQQLQQLAIDFTAHPAAIDEQLMTAELPATRAQRLAHDKAQYILKQHPQAVVIGSDQVCACGDEIFRKPKTRENNIKQLTIFSDREVIFYTALSVVSDNDINQQNSLALTRVQFRTLSTLEINRYVDKEQAFDCAGGFKMERLGLSLMASVHSDDPSALMGLPLIQLSHILRRFGYAIP